MRKAKISTHRESQFFSKACFESDGNVVQRKKVIQLIWSEIYIS